MQAAMQKEVSAWVEDIANTLSFAPDCTVTGHLYGGSQKLTSEVPVGYRVVSVNDHPTGDSGDLKEALLSLAAAAAPVRLVVERTDQQGPRVPIEASVMCDGAASSVAPADSQKVEKLVKAMQSTPPSAAIKKSPVTGGLPKSSASSDRHAAACTSPATTTTTTTMSLKSGAGRDETTSSPHQRTNSASSSHSFSESESSLVGFCTVPLSKKDDGSESPPDLLEFEKMKLSMAGEDAHAKVLRAVRDVKEMSVKRRLSTALAKAKPGRCVICVTQNVNPVAELELLALASRRRLVAFDLGVKLRLRPKPDVLAAQFAEAMKTGAWFALVNAHKSINTCNIFDELIADAHGRNLEGFDPNARIIVSLEPHPHFPKGLIHEAVVIKLVANFETSSIFADSMATSMSRNRLVTADALTASMLNSTGASAGNTSFSASITTAQPQKPPKRHVRINAAVDIVDIAPRDVVKVPSRDAPIDVSGSVALLKHFRGVPGDKFLCVRGAGESGRFAVGSSLGNVYFLDALGNSLLQAHAHNASIWDVSFSDKYSFATGCEDGTSASWKLSTTTLDDSVLVPTSATSLGADVYCVAYLKNLRPSPLLIGGLHNNLVIRPYAAPDVESVVSEQVHLVPIPLNAQVVDCLPNRSVALVGGGDGSVSVVDVERVESLGTLTEHTRKLPALSVRDDNQFFTGSFDSHILSWDLRVPGGVVMGGGNDSAVTASTSHTLKLKNYVTGLDVDDCHLAASVGENLYLWDIRKLGTVLGGYPQGWKGLSRGIKVQSDAHLVVTASPDGFVRFWNYV